MGMLGNQLAAGQALTVANDSFNGDGSTTSFTLSQTVGSVHDIEVLVDNVQQSPYDGSYSVSGTTLTFSGAPSTGTNNIYVIYNASKHITTQQVIPDDGSVTHSKFHTTALNPITLDPTNNRVGIGTTSPSQQFHVNSSGNTRALIETTNAGSVAELQLKNTAQTVKLGIETSSDAGGGAYVNAGASGFVIQHGSNAGIVVDTNGSVTKPRHPVCYGRLSNSGAQATNTVSSLQALYDPRSMVNTATAGAHKIVVPTTGVYEIKAAQLCDPVATYVYFYIRVNGATIYHAHNNRITAGSGSDNMDHRVNCNWSLAANDSVDFYYVGAATNVWNGNHSYFSVSLIG